MARINIEECWWSDPRRTRLVAKIGGVAADGAAVSMWRLAQEFWGRDGSLIPKHIFDTLEFSLDLVGVSLAEVRDCWVYVRGSSQYLDWHRKRRVNAQKAGKKSAKRARNAMGQLVNSSNDEPTTANDTPTKTNNRQPSDSDSDSGSDSYSGVRERRATARELKIKTVEDLRASIPLVTREQWAKRYHDPVWLNEQIEAAFAFHTADLTRIPQNSGQWMKKLHTWLAIGWERYKPAAVSPMPDLSHIRFDGEA